MRGMTLIELLVAISLLSLLSLAAYRGIDAMQRADAQLAERGHDNRRLDDAFARLADDFLHAIDGEFAAADAGELRFVRLDARAAASATSLRWRQDRLERQAAGEGEAAVLLTGVEQFSLRFLDAGGNWQNRWPPAAGLPRAVGVDLRVRLPSRPPLAIRRIFEVRG